MGPTGVPLPPDPEFELDVSVTVTTGAAVEDDCEVLFVEVLLVSDGGKSSKTPDPAAALQSSRVRVLPGLAVVVMVYV